MRINLILSLVKYQLIAAKPLEQFISGASKKKNKLINTILRIFALILISSSFLFLLGINYFGYLKLSQMLGIVDKGIAFCLFSSTLFLLFFSTTYLEHTYFRGKDTKIWRLLPISKSEFYMARFFANYIYSLLLNIIVVVPLIIAIFYYIGFSLLTFIASIFIFFLLPIVPLLISSMLVIIKVMIFKGKNIKIVDFFFTNGPFLVAILYLSRMSNEMTQMLVEGSSSNQLQAYYNYINNIGSLSYFSLMGKSFVNSLSLLFFIIISVILFILSALIISPFFEKCMLLIEKANNDNKKKNTKKNNSDALNSSSLFKTLVKRELFILQSEKGFLSESIGEMFIPIILIIVWQISGSLGAINNLIDEFSSTKYFVAIIFSIVHLFASFVMISSTSVSREGHTFKLNKLLPIDIKMMVNAKVAFHLIFISALQVVYLIFFCMFFNIPYSNLIWMIPLFIINSINISFVGLFLDYSNPKLEWEVGISAMKRNVNGIIAMLLSLVVIAPSLLILFFISDFVLLAIVVSLAITFVFKKLTYRAALNLVYQD